MNKQLYRGVFSYSCQLEREYGYAFSKEQARVIFCRRLAIKHDVHPSVVLRLFNGSRPNYEITVELEMREGES